MIVLFVWYKELGLRHKTRGDEICSQVQAETWYPISLHFGKKSHQDEPCLLKWDTANILFCVVWKTEEEL